MKALPDTETVCKVDARGVIAATVLDAYNANEVATRVAKPVMLTA